MEAFPDPHGIGQRAMARIVSETTAEAMLRSARDILGTDYTPPKWLAMHIRIYRKNRAEYDRALSILGGK